MTIGPKAQFSVAQHHRISIDANDWPSLVSTLSTHLNSYNAQDPIEHVAVACCASGMYGASPDAFKAEGLAEFRCQALGYQMCLVTKKGLSKHMGCPAGKKWKAYAKQLFCAQKQIPYFTSGFDAAIAAAYGATQ